MAVEEPGSHATEASALGGPRVEVRREFLHRRQVGGFVENALVGEIHPKLQGSSGLTESTPQSRRQGPFPVTDDAHLIGGETPGRSLFLHGAGGAWKHKAGKDEEDRNAASGFDLHAVSRSESRDGRRQDLLKHITFRSTESSSPRST